MEFVLFSEQSHTTLQHSKCNSSFILEDKTQMKYQNKLTICQSIKKKNIEIPISNLLQHTLKRNTKAVIFQSLYAYLPVAQRSI